MQLSLVIWGTHYHLNTVHSPHHITIRWCRQYIGMSAWSRHSIDTPTAGRAHCLFILSLATQWTYFLDIFPLNSPFATSTVLSVYFAPQITLRSSFPTSTVFSVYFDPLRLPLRSSCPIAIIYLLISFFSFFTDYLYSGSDWHFPNQVFLIFATLYGPENF